MNDEVMAYIEYLSHMRDIVKPEMPKFSTSAYTDNEYLGAIFDIMDAFEMLDDFDITLRHLKGD